MESVRQPSRSALAIAICLGTMGACGGPGDYDDCILRHAKSGMDKSAVAAVVASCRAKFPANGNLTNANKVDRNRELTPEEIQKLDGRAGISYGKHYAGSIYNGNATTIVTELELGVETTVGGRQSTRRYRTKTWIEPFAVGDFGFDIIVGDPGSQHSWTIVAARGRDR